MEDQIKILFIDDDDNLYLVYNKLLKEHLKNNFSFDHIGTAEEIEPTVLEKEYDIIILDQKLNNGNKGLDFLPLIKKHNLYSYVIINSAYGSEKLAAESIQNGADNYIQGNKDNNFEFIKIVQRAIESAQKTKKIKEMSSNFMKAHQKLEDDLVDKMKITKEKFSRSFQAK